MNYTATFISYKRRDMLRKFRGDAGSLAVMVQL